MLELTNTVKITVPDDVDNPYLQGHFKPRGEEFTADTTSMEVNGEVPDDLGGIYVRNSHNQVHAPLGPYHPFDGDGMLHSMHFDNGEAVYRNRFVRTTGFLAEEAAGKALWPGLMAPQLYQRRGWGAIGAMKDNAGTDVHAHAGKLLATMSQGSEPWRLDPRTLETLGPDPDWARLIPDGLSSHYKVDTKTGELMFFNYPERSPFMNYGVINAANEVVLYEPIDLPGARWPHDLGITENYSILHDLPYFWDPELLVKGVHKVEFHPDVPSRFGVIPRHGTNDDIRWFEGTPCYILHLTNSFEDGDEVVMDGCISLNPTMPDVGATSDINARITAHLDKHNTKTRMHRWRFNLATGATAEEMLDDEVTEFPMTANSYQGRPYRYSYNALFEPGAWMFTGFKRYDLETGSQQRFIAGPGRYVSEAQIALRPNAKSDDDGYLVTFISDLGADTSECAVFDAADIEAGPIAQIMLPERISAGTHACWVEGERIDGEAV